MSTDAPWLKTELGWMTRDPSLPLRRSLSQTPHTRSRAALQAAAQREHALSGLLQDLRRGALRSILMAASIGVSEIASYPRAIKNTRATEARTHCTAVLIATERRWISHRAACAPVQIFVLKFVCAGKIATDTTGIAVSSSEAVCAP